MTASIVIGSVPAVLVGSLLSSRAPDRYIRPVITFVIFASGLKYVGVPVTVLGWILGAIWLPPRVAGLGPAAAHRDREPSPRPRGAAEPGGSAARGTPGTG